MRLCLVFALAAAVYGQGEFAYPFTAKIQPRPTAAGQPADSFYLPRSARLTSFDANSSGSRILALSDMGSILEWTADNRIRRVAEGFKGPLQARVTNNGLIWVLDSGTGTLTRIGQDNSKTQILGSGTNREIDRIPGNTRPSDFDLAYFLLPRDGNTGNARMALDPFGNLFLSIAHEARGQGLITQSLILLRLQADGKELYLHWTVSTKFKEQPNSTLPTDLPPTPRIDAMKVDADRTVIFADNGKLFRLSSQGQLRDMSTGNLSVFARDPVVDLTGGPDGQTIIQTASGRLYSSVIGPLDGNVVPLGKLDGMVAQEGSSIVAIDLFADRLLRFQPTGRQEFQLSDAGSLLHTLPITDDLSIRPSFDAASGVTVDTLNLITVVDAGDGNLYEIAPNGAVRKAAGTDFVSDRTPPGRFATDRFDIYKMPYPIAAATKGSGRLLYLIDTSCNVFAQQDESTVRYLGTLPVPEGCANAILLFDPGTGGRLHIGVAGGTLFSGNGDPIAGDWQFTQVYAGGARIRAISTLTAGEFVISEGDGRINGRLRIFNPRTRAVKIVEPERALQTANLNMASATALGGGGVLAINNINGRRELTLLELTDAGMLLAAPFGTPSRVKLFNGDNEEPEAVFRHPRGAVVRSNAGRLYFYPNRRVPDQDLMVVPPTLTFGFKPGLQDQELSFLVRAASGTAIGYRTELSCTDPYGPLVRLGPQSGQTPATLTLEVHTDWVVLEKGRCTVTVFSVLSGSAVAKTEVSMEPDPETTRQIPQFGVLDVLTPLRIDPSAGPVTQSLRVANKTSTNKVFFLRGALPGGVSATPAALTVEPYSTQRFEIVIDPAGLRRLNYQIPLLLGCEGCNRMEDLTLSFQLVRGRSAMELSSESVRLDGATLALLKTNRATATYVTTNGITSENLETSIDFRKATPWFRVERVATRTMAPGEFLAQYDVVLTGATAPTDSRSAMVAFAVTGQPTAPKRFLTVYYAPSDTGVRSKVEATDSGGFLSLAVGQNGSIAVPVLNRSGGVLGYSVAAIDGGGKALSLVANSQGVVANGSSEVLLNIAGITKESLQAESKNVVLTFSNGEKAQYRLGVVMTDTAQVKSTAGLRALNKCASSRLVVVPKSPALPFSVVQNVGQRFVFEVRDECNQAINAADDGKLQFSVQPANGPVTATSVGNGLWEVFWKPERADADAKVQVVAVRASNEFEIYAGQVSVSGRVVSSTVPGLRSFSLVDAASFVEKQFTAPGSHITVFGDNLASAPAVSPPDATLPRELGNVEVLFDGRPAPLRYVSGSQINLQVPYDVGTNEYRMTVRVGDAVSAPASVVVGTVSPGIFTLNSAGSGQGLVFHRDEQGNEVLADIAHPARDGEEISVLASGLGVTDPPVVDGASTPALGDGQFHLTLASVNVRVDGVNVPAWAALTPGLIGVYRATITLPAGIQAGGAVPISLIVEGQESQTVTFAKQ